MATNSDYGHRMPLQSNGQSILIINEHSGEILHSKWNPFQKMLATGGTGDYFVDIWDFKHLDQIQPQPKVQLRHVDVPNSNDQGTSRDDDSHVISSVQWSNSGDRLLTSANDNIARVWSVQGKLQGLFSAQNSLIISCWNKTDTLIASGGEDTTVLIWKPNMVQKEPFMSFNQPGSIIDIAWQNDKQLAAASNCDIYLWTIELPRQPVRIWQSHENQLESIKWDPRGFLLASSALDDSRVFIWSPKQSDPIMSLNDHEGPIRDFKWSNYDASSTSQTGLGFIVTLSMDMTVKLFNIGKTNQRNTAECLFTLKHENLLISMALSPDNSLLAVGGENSDIYVWSLKEQKLLRSFHANYSLQNENELMNGEDQDEKEQFNIFDINWSGDGTVIAAGYGKSVVMLDLRKLLSQPVIQMNFSGSQNIMNLNQSQGKQIASQNKEGQKEKNSAAGVGILTGSSIQPPQGQIQGSSGNFNQNQASGQNIIINGGNKNAPIQNNGQKQLQQKDDRRSSNYKDL